MIKQVLIDHESLKTYLSR